MELPIAAALKAPGEVFEARLAERFPPELYGGREIRFLEPMVLTITYSFDGKAVAVSGELETTLDSTCARCAVPFRESVRVPIDERFVKGERPDEESYPFEGDTLELAAMALDNLFLNLPITSVCREDCKGLCPICGCNFNSSQCGCEPVQPAGPFGALSQLQDIGKEV